VAGVGAVHEGERGVGQVAADELGLVLDDGAVARLALPDLAQRRLAPGHLAAQGELGRRQLGEVVQHQQVVRPPRPRRRLDHAQRPDRHPVARVDRHAEVGDHAEVADRGVVAHERVVARVADHQRRSLLDDVPAEGVGQRRPARGGERLGQAGGARENLALGPDQGDERHGGAQHPAGEPGEPVEHRLGHRLGRPAPWRRGGAARAVVRFVRLHGQSSPGAPAPGPHLDGP
jgi:hypothetical protein